MITFEEAHAVINDLGALSFFPKDVRARLTLARLLRDFVTTKDQSQWLVRRMLQLFDVWPGPRELRALYCSRWKPRDGVEATSEKYPAPPGYPPEHKPEPKLLFNPSEISADPELERAVRDLAAMKDLNRRGK